MDIQKEDGFNFSILTNGYSRQSTIIADHTSVSIRTVFASWCLFCLIMTVTYSAHLVAGLGLVRQRVPFTTIQELVNQREYKWGIPSTSYAGLVFKSSTKPLYQQIWNGMIEFSLTDPDMRSDSDSVHMNKLENGGYVYITDTIHMASTLNRNCDIGYINEPLVTSPNSVVFAKNSPYTEIFSQEILRFHEIGITNRLEKKWISDRGRCARAKAEARAIDLLTVQSVFYLIAFGVGLSLVTFLSETLRTVITHLRQRFSSTLRPDKKMREEDQNN